MQSRASPHLAPWQLEATAPTRPCYTTVVEGAVQGRDMAAALGVLRTMEARGMLPSQRCLVRLIQGFAAEKNVAGALGVWRELRLLYPQGQTSKGAFEAVLSACVKDPMGVEAALGILGDMARSGWSLDRQFYLPMMVRACLPSWGVYVCDGSVYLSSRHGACQHGARMYGSVYLSSLRQSSYPVVIPCIHAHTHHHGRTRWATTR